MATVEQQITLAMAHLQRNQHAEAEEIAKAAVEEEPGNGAAQHVLGLAHYLQRRYDLAREHLHRAIKLDAKNALYASNHAECLRRLRKPEEALKEFERATILMPEFLKAHLGMGNTLRELGRIDEAIARFRLILAINPRFAEAYHYLAMTLITQEREAEAIPLLRKTLALRPNFVEAQMTLANLVEDDGEHDEAIDLYRKVLERFPAHPGALNNLGNLLKTLGRIDEAVEIYNKAIETNPDSTFAYYNLSRSKKADRSDDEEIKHIEELLERKETTDDHRVNLHFALGKLYDDVAEYEKAFHHFEMGNALDDRGDSFNPDIHAAAVDRMIDVFTEMHFNSRRGIGCESDVPVFVLGMPRSGTTLTEQILASHPDVFGAGELKFVGDLPHAISKAVGGGYPDSVYNLDAVTSLQIGEGYLRRLKQLATGHKVKRITDKMPGNFMHIGLIATLFPKAHIIHCVREPLDVCLSCFSQFFTAVMPFSKSLTSLGRYWREYDRLMAHWHAVLPGRIFDVPYPGMVNDTEATARKLVEHIGLEWNDSCLQFHKTDRPVKTASTWQVRQPIYTSSLERWRNYEPYLGPLLEAMGDRYRPLSSGAAPAAAAADQPTADAAIAEAS